MRYFLLICLSVFLAFSCKSDKTSTKQTLEKTVGKIDLKNNNDSNTSLANNAQTVKVDNHSNGLDPDKEGFTAIKTENNTTIEASVNTKTDTKKGHYSDVSIKTTEPKKVTTKKVPVKKAIPKRKKISKPVAPILEPKKEIIKEEPKPMAIIKFDNPVLDFGEITEGDIIEHDFFFTNTGNAPLQILEADATCGCTTPEIPFLDIAPGQKNKIHISYNSVNKEGYETPSVTLKTNGAPTYIKLNLFGTVKPNPDKKPIKLENPAVEAEGTVKEPNPVKVKEPNPKRVKEENPKR